MAEPLTAARFASALKILFPQKRLTMYGQKDQPFYSYVPKKNDFYGRKAEIPIKYSPGAGGNSHDFDVAYAGKGGSKYTHFEVERTRDYNIISIDAEALEASENDKGAYMDAKESETDSGFITLTQQLGADLQGDGTGWTGIVQSVNTSGAGYVVFRDCDMTRMEIGRKLQFSVSPFSALRAGVTGYIVVSAVDYDNNRVYATTGNGDTVSVLGITADDRAYPKGNFGASVSGTEAWIPSDRSILGTDFKGVTRSDFPSRLAGIYYDASSNGLIDGIKRGLARGAKERAFPDTLWVNFNRFEDIAAELGAKGQRSTSGKASDGYDALEITGGGRAIKVKADQNFTDETALATTKDSWRFWTLKGAPRFLTRESGSDMLIEPAADGFEMRQGWRGDLICDSPGENIRFVLPT
jgi:hypothetical protein